MKKNIYIIRKNLKSEKYIKLIFYWLNPDIFSENNKSIPVISLIFPFLFFLFIFIYNYNTINEDYDTIINGTILIGKYIKTTENIHDDSVIYYHEYCYELYVQDYVRKIVATVQTMSPVFYNKVHVIYKTTNTTQNTVLEYLDDQIQNLILSENKTININAKII
ncbi:hypothetical protein [Tenacibaculum finnmarkense]|uniref:hypothetical protein n=1 Tax=Tenacibaculum finnmarkense TaxID=2781243 RepID=UPI001E3EF0E0|nr:hypothetical protein [Tenacibaculum finnmarkense]MCD8412136.1 hypothetical protein [Tenacibaculum finnmarkense genomovar ulcerans]